MNESTHIPTLMKQLAEDTVAWVRDSYQATLDYSESSLEIVERLLDELYSELPRTESGELVYDDSSKDTIDAICNMFGGYLGETIKQHHGGEWTINEAVAEQPMVCLQIETVSVFPTAKVYKRLAHGDSDSISFYYAVLKTHIQELNAEN
jgi:hypothetical protein